MCVTCERDRFRSNLLLFSLSTGHELLPRKDRIFPRFRRFLHGKSLLEISGNRTIGELSVFAPSGVESASGAEKGAAFQAPWSRVEKARGDAAATAAALGRSGRAVMPALCSV